MISLAKRILCHGLRLPWQAALEKDEALLMPVAREQRHHPAISQVVDEVWATFNSLLELGHGQSKLLLQQQQVVGLLIKTSEHHVVYSIKSSNHAATVVQTLPKRPGNLWKERRAAA